MNFFREFRTEIKIFLIVVVVAVILIFGAILLLKSAQETPSPTGSINTIPPQAKKVFTAREDCESQTEHECEFVDCNIIDCAVGVSSGWSATDVKLQEVDIFTWQTYRNDEFGFEAKIHPNISTPGLSNELWAVIYEGEGNMPTFAAEFKIEARRIEEIPEDTKKFFQLLESSVPGEEIIGLNIGTVVKRESVVLNDCIATQYLVRDGVVKSYGTFCRHGESQIHFSLLFEEAVSDFAKEKAIEFYDQTLSTFRFVETPTLSELLEQYLEFQELFQVVVTANTGFSADDFSEGTSRQIQASYSYNAPEHETFAGPVWTISPQGGKAVSVYTSWGEPDSSLSIYNRDGQEKIEQLKSCGTPCAYWGTFWLNNDQFIFMESTEYHPAGETRCTVDTKCTSIIGISLFDLKEDTVTGFVSPEIDKTAEPFYRPLIRPNPNWPDWEQRLIELMEN